MAGTSFAGLVSAGCLMFKANNVRTCIAILIFLLFIFHFDWIVLYIAYGSEANVKPISIYKRS